MKVCALALPGSPGLSADVAVVEDDRLLAGLNRALATGADWVWILDGSATPRPGAIDILRAGLERVAELPPPSLLTGVVVGPDGRIADGRTPWYRRFQIHISLDSAERGLLPVRAAVGPTLVHRDAVAAVSPPPRAALAPGPVFEWTARLLRDRVGYLVSGCESEAAAPGRDPLRSPLVAARLILGRAVGRPDRVAVALEISERTGLAASGRRRP